MKVEIRKIHNKADLERAFSIRRKVFIEEQKVSIDDELDGLDESASHYLLLVNDDPLATARVRRIDVNKAKIERVAVIRPARGKGLGTKLMSFIEIDLSKNGYAEVVLGSQTQAKTFYAKLGYKLVGEEFEEAGIPHIKMVKKLN